MAYPGTPDWWLDRLYKKLRDRSPQIRAWNDWYIGNHPVPKGYEDADGLFARLMETVGLNMCAVVTDAPQGRMEITGFKVDGAVNDDIWQIWQANNFDRGSRLVRQAKMSLSESYVMVDPNNGDPMMTPEHPEQCVVEYQAGSSRKRAAAIKVWQDDISGPQPLIKAFLDLGAQGVYTYAAPTRIWANPTRSALALRPSWEFQPTESGSNPLEDVSIVPFPNRPRMLEAPLPEFYPAIPAQRRINKTILDRMAMQDQGAFKALWATGIKIPRDPVTGEPVEQFIKAINRVFINENPAGKFGQLEAEDIKQMLDAVRDDVVDCAMQVPTSPDQILGKLVNVSGDGLKLAQVSEIQRTKDRQGEEDDSWEDVNRLILKAAGKPLPKSSARMTTEWRNAEYRTDTEQANAAQIAIQSGMPEEVAWERYFNASPDDVKDWAAKRAAQAMDPVTQAIIDGVSGDAGSARVGA